MSDEELTKSLQQIKKMSKSNLRFSVFFIVLTITLIIAMANILIKGQELLDEKIALSPQHQLDQFKKQIKGMRKTAETQLDSIQTPEQTRLIEALDNNLKHNSLVLSTEESDFGVAITTYNTLLTRFSSQLGNVSEWNHFYQQRLNKLEHNSQRRTGLLKKQP